MINAINKINKMSYIKNLPVFIVSLNLNFLEVIFEGVRQTMDYSPRLPSKAHNPVMHDSVGFSSVPYSPQSQTGDTK